VQNRFTNCSVLLGLPSGFDLKPLSVLGCYVWTESSTLVNADNRWIPDPW